MRESSKAVFLSYASQDAEAAQRICDALRAAGLEVWFDRDELVGGDAWDQKIRRQIKECALFVPLITPNTNARAEGYFRLEWKLAVDRSHLMADDAPFLFPIVVGDVNDATARVPDRFREVQWTRLRLDETPGDLAARISRLLDGDVGRGLRTPPDSDKTGFGDPALQRKWRRKGERPAWLRHAWSIVGLAIVFNFVIRPMFRSGERGRSEAADSVAAGPNLVELAAPKLPARDWPKNPELKRAIALIEGLEAIPDDLALAEQIVKPIIERAPTDLEAVTVMARVQSQFMRRGFDRSDERSTQARLYGERALQLDPNEPEAMLAMATYHFSRQTGVVRAEKLLRRAMEVDPGNPRHGRMLADLCNATPGREAEAIAQSQENVRRFPDDALTRYDLARHYKDQGRYAEFDRELDATLALAPLPNAIAWKARLQLGLHNDFPGMKRWLDQVPERVRGTERTVFGYFLYAAFGGDAETGLAALRAFPQKWFTDFEYAGPTALLNACLLERQGKTELARQQYEAALLEAQRMKVTDPTRIWLNHAEF
ncbi:MAG: hypothetical protein QG602_4078, partial [Verrucomicrobiota bacterium]|nr:hypothetical protein [Verrucomicrobiota bacterium]